MTDKIVLIVLSNYPFYTDNLEDLQGNWNILSNLVDEIFTESVYKECMQIPFLYDIMPASYNVELFKANLKVLFAKTNKSLLKLKQNYPTDIFESVFAVFTDKLAKKILDANLDTILAECSKINPLYLLATGARANMWKDNKVTKVPHFVGLPNWNPELIAAVVFTNALLYYYGDYELNAGDTFIVSVPNFQLEKWDGTFTEPSRYITDELKIGINTSTWKLNSTANKLVKYSNPTALISGLLLNDQNPFQVDYSVIPMIATKYLTISDFELIAEEYIRQSDRPWFTYADILIGFDENDTYSNQTFKRIAYNAVMRKVCNWTLFVPLNTFFDCSNINKLHEDKKMSILPSQLVEPKIDITAEQLPMSDVSEETKELMERATKPHSLGKVLNINCMQLSNPPTESELQKYTQLTEGFIPSDGGGNTPSKVALELLKQLGTKKGG